MSWEWMIGLETHVELSTKTKIFCGCAAKFGGPPNTNCCPVCIGLPGTLPTLNRKAVRLAIIAGLALDCEIHCESEMARKNYVYPDLSKAYQITQAEKPLCENGSLRLESGKEIRIQRIHIEEDAGKLFHQGNDVLVDYNRGGVPLIEIVTQPDFRTAEEVREYLERLQVLMRWLKVSDCKMQEGSLRCDVNVSVRRPGDVPGVRTEIKNVNSISYIAKAIAYEANRQISLLEAGKTMEQETRRFDERTGITRPMRGKEDAQDYRYFPEPDLPPVWISPEEIESLRHALPELPEARTSRYQKRGMSRADAKAIVKFKAVSDYFDRATEGLSSLKAAANLMTGMVFSCFVNEQAKEACQLPISAEQLRELLQLAEAGEISLSLAKTALEKMLEQGVSVRQVLAPEDLQEIGEETLQAWCEAAVATLPKAAADVRAGKQKAMGALLGYVMKQSRGRAQASEVQSRLARIMAR